MIENNNFGFIENIFKTILDHSPAAIAIFDRDMRYIAYSPRYLTDYQLGQQNLVGKSHHDVFPEIPQHWHEEHLRCLHGESIKTEGEPFQHPDGHIEYVHREIQPWFQPDGTIGGIVLFSELITRRVQNETRIKNLTRLYATLSQVNQTIVWVKNQKDLFDRICKVAIEFGKFNMAWIGWVNVETGDVNPLSIHGQAEELPLLKNINFQSDPLKNGLIARSVSSDTVVTSRDIQTEPRMKYWQYLSKEYDYHSAAVVPIHRFGQVVAILMLFAEDVSFFDNDDQDQLLNEMSLDISFALENIEKENHRQIAEKKVREGDQRFQNLVAKLNDIVWTASLDRKTILDLNPSFEDILGISLEQVKNNSNLWFELVHPEDQDLFQNSFKEMEETGKSTTEYRVIRPDGEIRWLFDQKAVIYDEQNQPSAFGGITKDITQRKGYEEQTKQQLVQLMALHDIDQSIMGSTDIRLILKTVLDQIIKIQRVDAACFSVFDQQSLLFEYVIGQGFTDDQVEKLPRHLGESTLGRACLERKVYDVHNHKAENDLTLEKFLINNSFTCYYVVPLIVKGNVEGALEVFVHQHQEHPPEWLNYLLILAGQAAIAIDNIQLFDNLHRSNIDLKLAYDATIEGWSRAMDLRDRETEGHTQRVSEITLKMAQLAGIQGDELIHIRRGALLHDIGKLGIPDAVLFKPGPLDDQEWELMRQHPVFAYEMLSPIRYLQPALDIPYCHHEKYDGTGYPRGLKGDQIPLAGRLFAVVDVWDALRSDRPYRKAWPENKALEYIKSGTGTHFDPMAVKIFEQVVQKNT